MKSSYFPMRHRLNILGIHHNELYTCTLNGGEIILEDIEYSSMGTYFDMIILRKNKFRFHIKHEKALELSSANHLLFSMNINIKTSELSITCQHHPLCIKESIKSMLQEMEYVFRLDPQLSSSSCSSFLNANTHGFASTKQFLTILAHQFKEIIHEHSRNSHLVKGMGSDFKLFKESLPNSVINHPDIIKMCDTISAIINDSR